MIIPDYVPNYVVVLHYNALLLVAALVVLLCLAFPYWVRSKVQKEASHDRRSSSSSAGCTAGQVSIYEKDRSEVAICNDEDKGGTNHEYDDMDDDSSVEDSILAAVSVLFLESGDADDDDDRNVVGVDDDEVMRSRRAAAGEREPENLLVARILPVGQSGYQRQKPIDHACDSVNLRQILMAHLTASGRYLEDLLDAKSILGQNDSFTADDDDESNSNFCLLETTVTLPSKVDPSARHCISINLQRLADELATRSLRRLALSVHSKYLQQERVLRESRSIRTSQGLGEPSVGVNGEEVTLLVSGSRNGAFEEASEAADQQGYRKWPLTRWKCASLWEEMSRFGGCKLQLRLPNIGDAISVPILACPPTVLSVQTFENFGACTFVGVPSVIEVQAVHASHCVITWFADEQVVCEDSSVYTPRAADIGKVLSILVVPLRQGHLGIGYEESYRFEQLVQPLPTMPLISPLRNDWIVDPNERKGTLRIMTYNLLADLYTTRELDQQVMYNHCPAAFMCRKRRMPMLLYELLIYRADIICLQEVDQSIFDRLFRPCLEAQDYQGFYSNKASSQLEGCAMFWSLRCFERVQDPQMRTFQLRDSLRQILNSPRSDPIVKGIATLMQQNPELRRVACEKVGQILQMVHLRIKSCDVSCPESLMVANTHLFYHPLAGHIRALQAYVVAHQVDAERGSQKCPVVFCGDLNAHPMSGAVQLLVQRHLPSDHYETWKHLNDYHWAMGDQEFLLQHGYIGNNFDTGPTYEEDEYEDATCSLNSDQSASNCSPLMPAPVELKLPERFPRLVSGCSCIPPFTNYAIDFAETLDYILLSDASSNETYGLAPLKSAPVLSVEEMRQYGAMPNEFMPSDHLSLVVDATWIKASSKHPC